MDNTIINMGKENVNQPESILETPARQFGRELSRASVYNTPQTSISKQKTSTKKKFVRVRKAPSTVEPRKLSSQSDYYTVNFLPGPLGLHLEPVSSKSIEGKGKKELGCRVVDAGPQSPGTAAYASKINPGDLVARINGKSVLSADHKEIMRMLNESSDNREVVFRSMCNRGKSLTTVKKRTQYSPPSIIHFSPSGMMQPKQVSPSSTMQPKQLVTVMKAASEASEKKQYIATSELFSITSQSAKFKSNLSSEATRICDDELVAPVHFSPNSFSLGDKSAMKRKGRINKEDQEDSGNLFELESKVKPPPISPPAESGELNDMQTTIHGKRYEYLSPNQIDNLPEKNTKNDLINAIQQVNFQSMLSPSKIKGLQTYALQRFITPAHISNVLRNTALMVVSSSSSLKLGEALVGHSSKEFDDAIRKKMQLLQELSHATFALHTKEDTIRDLTNERESERRNLLLELDSSRNKQAIMEKQICEMNANEKGFSYLKKDFEMKISQANDRATKLSQEKEDIQRRMLDAHDKVTELSREREEIHRRMMEANDRALDFSQQKEDYMTKELEGRLNLAELQQQLKEMSQSKTTLESTVVRLREEVEKKENLGTGDLITLQASLDDALKSLANQGDELIKAQAEKTNVELQLTNTQKELEKAKTTVYQLQKTKSELKESENKLSNSLEEVIQESQQLRDDLECSKENLARCEADKSKAQADLEMLKIEFSECNKDLTRLKLENDDLEKNATTLKLDKEGAAEEKRDLQDELNTTQRELSEAKNKISYIENDLRERQLEMTVCKEDFEVTVAKMRDDKEFLKKENKTLDTELSESKATNSKIKEENDSLKKEVKDLKNVGVETFSEKSRIIKELQTTKIELSETQASERKMREQFLHRIKTMDLKFKEVNDAKKQTDAELVSCNAKLEEANLKIEALRNDNDQIKLSLEEAAKNIKCVKEEKDHIANLKNMLKEQLAECERQNSMILDESRASEAGLIEARSQISFLESKVKAAESSKKLMEHEINAAIEANGELSGRVNKLRGELENKENMLSSNSMDILRMQSTIEDLRANLENKAEEKELCQQSLDTLQNQYNQLNKRLSDSAADATKEKNSMATELISTQDQLSETKKQYLQLQRQEESLRRRIIDLEEQLSSIQVELVSKAERLQQVENSFGARQKEFDDRIYQLSTESSNFSTLSKAMELKCEKLSEDNDDLLIRVSGLEKELFDTQEFLTTEKAKYAKENKELSTLFAKEREKAAALSEALRLARLETETRKNDIEKIRKEHEDNLHQLRFSGETKVRKYVEKLKEKEKEMSSFLTCKENLKNMTAEKQKLEESQQRSNEEIKHLNEVIDKQQMEHLDQIDNLSKSHLSEVERLVEDKKEMESTLCKAQESRQKIQVRLEKLEKDILTEKAERENLCYENEALSTNLRRAEDMVVELRCELDIIQEEAKERTFDSLDSGIAALTRSELKEKCKFLEEEVMEVETRAAEANFDASNRAKRITGLESDLGSMADEIRLLIGTNELLEGQLIKTRSAKETLEADVEALRSKLDLHQKESLALKAELDSKFAENSSLSEQLRKDKNRLGELQIHFNEREQELKNESTELKKSLLKLEEKYNETLDTSTSKQKELDSLRKEIQVLEERFFNVENDLSEFKSKLDVSRQENEKIRLDARASEEILLENTRALQEESDTLKSKISDLEEQIDTQSTALNVKQENESTLIENLENQRKLKIKMESMWEDAQSKLAEATRVIAALRGTVQIQESRALEAERSVASLSEQARRLQETIKKMESSSETNDDIYTAKIAEMQKKYSALEKERTGAKNEACSLRDELRQTNRKANELERVNASLQSRIENLKDTFDRTKVQLREVRDACANSSSSTKNLENELESKRMEIDHLNAKLQVAGATVSRLKSDRVLLQEAARQAELKSIVSDEPMSTQEINRLKADLQSKSSQLSSAAASVKAQQKTIMSLRQTEQELIQVSEQVINRADAAFRAITSWSLQLGIQRCTTISNDDLEALDLAKMGNLNVSVENVRAQLGDLESLVQGALLELNGRRNALETLKLSTDDGFGACEALKGVISDSSVISAFKKMKEVIQEQLTPVENEYHSLDGVSEFSHLEEVVRVLESQLDALVIDLKSANEALKNKDKITHDLEKIISQHESERGRLENKLASMDERAREMARKMKEEVSRKVATERELEHVRNDLAAIQSNSLSADETKTAAKVAAARMICGVFESRSKVEAGAVFRKWSCSASAMHAISHQTHAATALAQQLESTREKLIILKSHFRKSRNGGNEARMLRILERLDENQITS